MKQLDIESLRVREAFYNVPPAKTKVKKSHKLDTWFIAAMPGPWIAKAAKLPGHALHVALAIMYVRGMTSGKEIILTRFHFNRFYTARGPARRGLDSLQQAGLVRYVRCGHQHKVTVLSIEEDDMSVVTDIITK